MASFDSGLAKMDLDFGAAIIAAIVGGLGFWLVDRAARLDHLTGQFGRFVVGALRVLGNVLIWAVAILIVLNLVGGALLMVWSWYR